MNLSFELTASVWRSLRDQVPDPNLAMLIYVNPTVRRHYAVYLTSQYVFTHPAGSPLCKMISAVLVDWALRTDGPGSCIVEFTFICPTPCHPMHPILARRSIDRTPVYFSPKETTHPVDPLELDTKRLVDKDNPTHRHLRNRPRDRLHEEKSTAHDRDQQQNTHCDLILSLQA